jgi:putative ABC transport system permease protein
MGLLSLAVKSLFNRWVTAMLTVAAIALSVMLLLGVERVRTGARESFANTISGTDLIVGARGGRVQLLLYTVFRIGSPVANVSWESYQDIAALPEVDWTVPLSMGDSHRGYRVVGTTAEYFQYYRFGRKQVLSLKQGDIFDDLFDAVLGSDVAGKLGYRLGDEMALTHGIGSVGLQKHEDKPFRVAGILERTGTPVDRTIHISLEGLEAVHADWIGGAHLPGDSLSAEQVRQMELKPDSITAVLVGLKSRRAAFSMQRAINQYRDEPLLAIMPGVTLQELWDAISTAETALMVISTMVVISGLLGMITMTLAGLNERRREMAILRSVGARPNHIFGLLTAEAGVLAFVGSVLGLAMLYLALILAQPLITARYGLYIAVSPPIVKDWIILTAIVLAGLVAGFVPAYRAYRYSLADGMLVHH